MTATIAVGPFEFAQPISEPVALPAHPVRTALNNVEFHLATAASSQHEFSTGVVDVLLFKARETQISGFDFGEDVIVIGGGSNLVGWLRQVDVVGNTAQTIVANESVIWLMDSFHTIA